MGLFEELQSLMVKYHFRPDKKLSQFFCINDALLQFLANRAEISKGDVVLEIGPGTGFLTRRLLEKAKRFSAKVVAIEADDDMCRLLGEEFRAEIDSGLLKLIEGNALEQDYERLGVTKIVSLPPYNISSALATKIALTKGITKVVIVFDKGFAQKLLAFEGLTEYVALTVLVNLNAKIEVLEDIIEQKSFFPAPNCLSTVIQMDFDSNNNSKEFFILLRELFRHKNKDLYRSLKQSFLFLQTQLGWSEKDFESKLLTVKHSGKKVYLLSPKEFLEVYQHFAGTAEKKKPAKK